MAIVPLNKTKIIKKHTKHTDRYQCDRFGRVKVSIFQFCIESFRNLGENPQVLMEESEGDIEVFPKCPRLDVDQTRKLNIFFPTD